MNTLSPLETLREQAHQIPPMGLEALPVAELPKLNLVDISMPEFRPPRLQRASATTLSVLAISTLTVLSPNIVNAQDVPVSPAIPETPQEAPQQTAPNDTKKDFELTARFIPNKKGKCGTGIFTFKPEENPALAEPDNQSINSRTSVVLRPQRNMYFYTSSQKGFWLPNIPESGRSVKFSRAICRSKLPAIMRVDLINSEIKNGFESWRVTLTNLPTSKDIERKKIVFVVRPFTPNSPGNSVSPGR